MKPACSSLKLACGALMALLALPAPAAPSQVVVNPPSGARFLEDQRFDIRVEGLGTGPFQANLEVDGVPVAFSSGKQNSNETDGISPADTAGQWGGFNVRGYSIGKPGLHTLTATFTDSTGTVTASSAIHVLGIHAGAMARSEVA